MLKIKAEDKYVLGLMSGTSMDGIDTSLVNTNGKSLTRTNYQLISKFGKKTTLNLKKLMLNTEAFLKNKTFINELSRLITKDHEIAVKKIIKLSGIIPDLIGFHGQTILHDPSNKTSLQIGDGKLLSKLTNIKVISNFRENDLLNNGEGAPIAPIYHKHLIEKYKFELPCCFVNIGGVANITYWDGRNLLGYDLGPGNGLMDLYCQKNFNISFDFSGKIASKGSANKDIIKKFKNSNYFKKKYPKSLDKLEFIDYLNLVENGNLSHNDALATLLECSLFGIISGIKMLPSSPKHLIIMGGGQHNKELCDRLINSFIFKVEKASDINIPGDFIEAELIAFLAARKFYALHSTCPETTGVKSPCILGTIYDT